ncbi:hypothetical protein [Pleionea sp. CnH1-48]|uniref:hypothetical protein n=1 Tax=Pleionea sp. CnH1-48 TaxID=2954494 RepID=UPI002096EA6D|nr:hypothetical protein [Pleionea sp. CnH1-48]MCO7223863.1 hypothetical protein [Pleionea sp. CnH1-48]
MTNPLNKKTKLKTQLTGLALGLMSSASVMAFTQIGGSGAIPMGHEWLTRTSALELLNSDHLIAVDPNDPRGSWSNGLAKNIDLTNAQNEVARLKSFLNSNSLYEPRYDFVFSAIIGERWVDTAGFNVTKSTVGKIDCFNAVAQEPADLQQDHYMRRYDDKGAQGGVDAARRSQVRFINHFVNAAMAKQKQIKAWDGGGYSTSESVDQNYFLFGRAVHLFQDSFSPEHTVRLPDDNYEKVRQVKAYLCSEGAEQHTHDTTAALNFTSGDVIWNTGTRLNAGWGSYKVSSMKPVALVAMEASKDLWAGFIRTMATPYAQREAVARAEAQTLVDNWLSFDEAEMLSWYHDESHRDHTYVLNAGESGKGMTQRDCMLGLGVESGNQADRVAELEDQRRQCLYNVQAKEGYSDLNDPHMDIPFNWEWKSAVTWQTPSSSWQIPQLVADSGKTVVIKNSIDSQPLVVDGGLNSGETLYSQSGNAIEFIMVEDGNKTYFRTKDNADLFMSYTYAGRGQLHNSANQNSYEVKAKGALWTIKNIYWNDYFWFYQPNRSPYVTGTGNANKAHSQWIIEAK